MDTIIPRAVLFGNPAKTNPQVSPDGKTLAYLAPVADVLNVWRGPLYGDQFMPITQDRDRGVREYLWAEDNKHLLYLQDADGNENWHLYKVNAVTLETTDLTPFTDVSTLIIGHNKNFPTTILVALNKDNPQFHDVYRLDIETGDLELIAKNLGNFLRWRADADLQVRSALASLPDGGFDLMIRDSPTAEWRIARHWDEVDSLNCRQVAFSKDGTHIYLEDSVGSDTSRLVSMDIASGHIDILAEDPQYDVDEILIHPDDYTVQAVSFVKDRCEWVILDSKVAGDFAAIARIRSGDFDVISRDDADTTWIVKFTVDDAPISYYAYDRTSGRVTHLFVDRPDLAEYKLAPMEPIEFTARDGLTIHGYLTLPIDKGRTNLPLVLHVHGGPWDRSTWGYYPEAAWLADRGYACLRVNFRGSVGYGKKFVNAGDKEWGAKMHDDLVDAVAWAIAQGIADPRRVAIYGWSYGGYAALVGATFTPDLFCCALDMVGPSNLVTLIRSIPPYWSVLRSTFNKRVGNPDTEEDFLGSRSPLFKVDAIKIPLLIAQGANDPRVKQAESEQIVAALKGRGIEFEYLLFADEGHGFAKPENRLRFYAAAERFLARKLGGRVENGPHAL